MALLMRLRFLTVRYQLPRFSLSLMQELLENVLLRRLYAATELLKRVRNVMMEIPLTAMAVIIYAILRRDFLVPESQARAHCFSVPSRPQIWFLGGPLRIIRTMYKTTILVRCR